MCGWTIKLGGIHSQTTEVKVHHFYTILWGPRNLSVRQIFFYRVHSKLRLLLLLLRLRRVGTYFDCHCLDQDLYRSPVHRRCSPMRAEIPNIWDFLGRYIIWGVQKLTSERDIKVCDFKAKW